MKYTCVFQEHVADISMTSSMFRQEVASLRAEGQRSVPESTIHCASMLACISSAYLMCHRPDPQGNGFLAKSIRWYPNENTCSAAHGRPGSAPHMYGLQQRRRVTRGPCRSSKPCCTMVYSVRRTYVGNQKVRTDSARHARTCASRA